MSSTVVIRVDHAYVRGGQSKVAIESALGLRAKGAHVIFFSACGPVDLRLGEAGVAAPAGNRPPRCAKRCAPRALVFPSLWYEGLPLTVPEALSLGTPAIVSDVCAARESIVDGDTGLLFKSGDASTLARALMKLKDDDLVARMSAQVYDAWWRKPMSLARHIDETLGVYEKALAKPHAP